jgi:hypothetical protein
VGGEKEKRVSGEKQGKGVTMNLGWGGSKGSGLGGISRKEGIGWEERRRRGPERWQARKGKNWKEGREGVGGVRDLMGQGWEGFQGRRNGVGGEKEKRVSGGKQGKGEKMNKGRG